MAGSERTVETDDGLTGSLDERGRLAIPTPEGGVIYRTNWREKSKVGGKHTENLALTLDPTALAGLADELLREIAADDMSRREYIESLAKAVDLLGTRIEDNASAASESSAPVDGTSTFRHPLLLQSTIRFQADFVAELLPADGPVKVRDDSSEPPTGTPDQQDVPGATSADLAMALQSDLNHYLTTTATEYYPDTTRMAFRVGLFGTGFKKVYNCPLRRRPVSESIDVNDLIVDYAATDLRNAARVTHRIMMRHNVLRRMVKADVYRNVELGTPLPMSDALREAEDRASGLTRFSTLPSDHLHTIYECCTERDIEDDDFNPYKITIDKDSHEILSIYRNWDEADKLKLPRQEIVPYFYVNALGFYAMGLVHILGNTVRALTAAFREFIDSGMFANFPGFLYAADAGKQVTNQFRVPPGAGVPIQTGGKPMGEIIGQLPYKSPDAAFMAFIQHIEESGRALGGEASTPLSEGTANMPVGTMVAQIEQALKPMKGVFKGLHRSQAEEFRLFKQRFREDPEALWRFNPKPARQWEVSEFLSALDQAELVPMADPNTASQVQRIAVAWSMLELAKTAPYLFHERDTALRFMRMVGIPDPEGILASAQEIAQAKAQMGQQKGSDNPALIAAKAQQAQAAAGLAEAQTAQAVAETQTTSADAQASLQDKASERQFRATEMLAESQERDADRASHLQIAKINQESAQQKTGSDLAQAGAKHSVETQQAEIDRQHEAGMQAQDHAHAAGIAGLQAMLQQEKTNEVQRTPGSRQRKPRQEGG
jgi:hypothetical protein